MADKYIMFSLEDEKSKKLGEVISSSSCKKIVNLLAEKEMSESEISKKLEMPLNTIGYNIKKLEQAGLVEKAKRWWSVKGRKIETYKLANKLIVISPKKKIASKLAGIVPVAIISGIFAGILGWYYKFGNMVYGARDIVQEESLQTGADAAGSVSSVSPDIANVVTSVPGLGSIWLWILAGSLITLILFSIWNWKKL